MTTTSRLLTPASPAITYELRIAGHLDDHWSGWLGGRALVRNGDASTTVTVEIADQAQLHGILAGIRDIGVSLLSLNVVDGPPAGYRGDGMHFGQRQTAPSSHAGTAIEPEAVPSVLQHTLDSARLTLRPATADDADATWRYRRLDSVNEWLTGVPATVEAYRTMFVEPPRLASTVIVELTNDRPDHLIGDFMLRREDAWSQNEVAERARGAQDELGWVLDPGSTGAGYATEAVRELLRYCFEELRVHRVVANCFLDNDASWRLMERVGMRREVHAVRESLHRSGRWLDTVGYAILVDEWTG